MKSNACAQSLAAALCLYNHSDVVANLQNYLCNFCTLRCPPSLLQCGGRRWKDLWHCVCLSFCMSICSSAVYRWIPVKIKGPVFGREIVKKYHVNLEEYFCTNIIIDTFDCISTPTIRCSGFKPCALHCSISLIYLKAKQLIKSLYFKGLVSNWGKDYENIIEIEVHFLDCF